MFDAGLALQAFLDGLLHAQFGQGDAVFDPGNPGPGFIVYMARAAANARPQFQNGHVQIQGQRIDQFSDSFLPTDCKEFRAPQFLQNLKPLGRSWTFAFGLFFFIFLVPNTFECEGLWATFALTLYF